MFYLLYVDRLRTRCPITSFMRIRHWSSRALSVWDYSWRQCSTTCSMLFLNTPVRPLHQWPSRVTLAWPTWFLSWHRSLILFALSALIASFGKALFLQLILLICLSRTCYSRNQQMTLYECVKYDSDHPLTLSNQHPFDIRKTYTHGEMRRKSMITNVSTLRVPIVKQTKDHTLVISSLPARSNRDSEARTCAVPFEHPGSEHLRLYSSKPSASSCICIDHVSTNAGDDWSAYINLINGWINSEPSDDGSILSIVKGNKNSNKLFFNLFGNYRYCPRKGCHHLHSSVAFIVDYDLPMTLINRDRVNVFENERGRKRKFKIRRKQEHLWRD